MGRVKKVTAAVAAGKRMGGVDPLADLASESDLAWDLVFRQFHRYARTYGFWPIETPLLEDASLYQQVVGSAEVFGVELPKRSAAVRIDLLPSVLRSYGLRKTPEQNQLSKWLSDGWVSRRQLSGEIASDYRFNLEILGTFTHLTEAQAICCVWEYAQSLSLSEVALEVNTVGSQACQEAYADALKDFLSVHKYELCDECTDHLSGRVLNVFRCQNMDCQTAVAEAPTALDFLDQDSNHHFTLLLEALDELAVPYQLSPHLVGPDGWGKTAVALSAKGRGQQRVLLAEGGYHDEMAAVLTGKRVPCFGLTGSLVAARTLVEQSARPLERELRSEVFLVPLGELASKKSLRLFRDLTNEQVSVYDHFGTAGVKNQLKLAEASRAPIALIIGQKEAMDDLVILRDVKSGMQEVISSDKIINEVKKRLGK